MALVLLVVAVTLCAASSVRVERLATNTPAELSIVVAAPPLRRSSAGRYVTLALPPGVTVTAVEVVERSVGGGVRPTDAGVMGPQYLDCRSIRCPELPVPLAVGDPRRALGDTGLYFSEAPSTRPRGPVGSSPWDDIQSSRAEALGVVAVVSNVGPQWVGTLSPVAGLETYYSHAWDGSRFVTGPWQRIACAGARIAGSAPVQPLAKASQEPAVASTAGLVVSATRPLPVSTVAIRAALGEGANRALHVRMRILDEAALRAAWGPGKNAADHACVSVLDVPRLLEASVWSEPRVGASCLAVFATLPVQLTLAWPRCNGASDGSASVQVMDVEDGGPFEVQWDGGARVLDHMSVDGLAAGPHTLMVHSMATNQHAYERFVVPEPARLALKLSLLPQTQGCDGSNATLIATVSGGTPPWVLTWDTVARATNGTSLTLGLYHATVTDAHGCAVASSYLVTAVRPVTVALHAPPTPITCRAGSLSVAVQGGVAPFVFRWRRYVASGGFTALEHTGAVLNDVVPGDYCVVATDSRGCTSEHGCWPLAKREPLHLRLVARNAPCRAGRTVDLVLGGGRLPYLLSLNKSLHVQLLGVPGTADTHRFADGGGVMLSWAASDSGVACNVSALSSGDLGLLVRDADACAAGETVHVPVDPVVVHSVQVVSKTLPRCAGHRTGVLEAVVTAPLGTPLSQFSYVWSTGATEAIVRRLPPGEYHVTVTAPDGCAVQQHALLGSQKPPMTVEVQVGDTDGSHCPYDGSASVLVHGGVAPYAYEWSHDASLHGPSLGLVHCGNFTVVVTDAHGCSTVVAVEVPCRVVATMEIRRKFCTGHQDTFLGAVVHRAEAPYRILWNDSNITDTAVYGVDGWYQVSVTDARGCVASVVGRADVRGIPRLHAVMHVLNATEHGHAGAIRVDVTGGSSPIAIEWSDGRRVASLDSAFSGHYAVTVSDSAGCTVIERGYVGEARQVEEGPSCPQLHDCQRFADGNKNVYVTCLRRLIANLTWNLHNWEPCAVRSLVYIARSLEREHGSFDVSSVFVGLLLGQAYDYCLHERPHCHGFSWDMISPFMKWSDPVWARYSAFLNNTDTMTFAQFKADVLPLIFGVPAGARFDVLILGPYGFNNEYVFGPSLHFPSRKLRVAALMLKTMHFPADAMSMIVFPWSLQIDVELATLYVLEVVRLVRPRFVVPGDSAAILINSKLGVRLSHVCANDCGNCDGPSITAIKNSIRWPPEYPPHSLSKLIPGHEAFAPEELVFAENDLFGIVYPDIHPILNFTKRSVWAYLKREYSEAGVGVKRSQSSEILLRPALDKLLVRSGGMALMDLDMKVRSFVQKEVRLAPGSKPLGLRFYAHHGRLLSGHISLVTASSATFGVTYVTVRDEETERRTVDFVRAINYTGFGACWWWKNVNLTSNLIDFNARLERHACIGPVVSGTNLQMESCHLFQRLAAGELAPEDIKQPFFMPAGIQYMEALRALQEDNPSLIRHLADPSYKWNIWKEDTQLYKVIHDQVQSKQDLIRDAVLQSKAMEVSTARSAERTRLLNLAHTQVRSRRCGWTPLHDACLNNDTDLVALLLQHGADVSVRDMDGTTPLHLAAQVGSMALVQLLANATSFQVDARKTSCLDDGRGELHTDGQPAQK